MAGSPLVISASRRTDLPGFYSEICAERIEAKISRLRTRYLYGVVFWTRWPHPFTDGGPLAKLNAKHDLNPVVNLTVTGRGGTALEPGVPSTEAVFDRLSSLVRVLGDEPWRIRWRFDPVLPGERTLDDFDVVSSHMARMGVPTCTFSFPAYRSLKGDLTPQFEAAGISRFEEGEKRRVAAALGTMAEKKGIRLLSCNQPENLGYHPHIRPASCIPADVLTRGFRGEGALPDTRDPSQRTHCNCARSEDIGDYDLDVCGGGCAYCYSKAGGPR